MSTRFSLSFVESSAVAFLDYAETLGRPLLRNERQTFRWILNAFESVDCEGLDESKYRYLENLMVNVRELIAPDPVAQHIRIKIGQKLSKREMAERLELFDNMVKSIGVLAEELDGESQHARQVRIITLRAVRAGRRFAASLKKGERKQQAAVMPLFAGID